jgi:hypothetical protein
VFFVVNLPAGLWAALAASRTEFIYRAVAAGFYGAVTARFARCHNRALATASALIVVPVLSPSVEYFVHLLAGTPALGTSVLASILMTLVTTRFNLFAMRRGMLLVGPGQQSLTADVRQVTTLAMTGLRRLGAQSKSRAPWRRREIEDRGSRLTRCRRQATDRGTSGREPTQPRPGSRRPATDYRRPVTDRRLPGVSSR